MKQQIKSIALFDDRSRVSNFIRLYFQKEPYFSVSRVYSGQELDHKMKKTPFDFLICPARCRIPLRKHSGKEGGVMICLYWSIVENEGSTDHSSRHIAFQFEIETPHSSLSYNSSSDDSLEEQFEKVSRFLVTIRRYHQDFIRFQNDTELLQSIVEDSSTAVLYLLRNKIQWINRESLRILGKSERDILGREFSSLFPDDSEYREVMRHLSKNRDAGGWGTAACSLIQKTGGIVDCTIRMRRLNPMNSEKGYLVFLHDEQERKRLEHALEHYQQNMVRNEAKYLEILKNLNLIIIATDLNGCITFWNGMAEATLGYHAPEVSGKNIIDMITDPESRTARDMSVLLYDSGAIQENSVMHVLENRKRSGDHLWIAWNTLIYRDSSGMPSGMLWIGQDISDIGKNEHSGCRQQSWKQKILQGTDVREEVFDILFHTAIELGRGGRESRKIGTSFLIGDAETVMATSRQCAINPFEGKNPEQRMVHDRGNIENIKNLSLLDGAFVIDGSGVIHASSRHLLADAMDIDIPEGLGTRHASVAAMTNMSRSVGIVISESGGTITIFKDGKMVKQIMP